MSDEKVAEDDRLTLETKPRNPTCWSTRSRPACCGLSTENISSIWRTFGQQPNRTESFMLSTDPLSLEKVRDIVRLYVRPPQNALVLGVDEKSQIQAFERSQPVLPLSLHQPECHNSYYFRHGTLPLFAGLDVATGEVCATCQKRGFLGHSQTAGKVNPDPSGHSHGDAQLHSPYDSIRTPQDHPPPTPAAVIDPHPQQLGQPGGTILWQAHAGTNSPRQLSQRTPTAPLNPRLAQTAHPEFQVFRRTASAELILSKIEYLCQSLT